ncbi:MAG: tRNA lysidine(34) synthetase TilS [Candidatus Sulfotelmatobacter sp.]
MYDGAVHELAQILLKQVRREELLTAGDHVGVAVSGGIDSVALLRLLMDLRQELGVVVSVVHFNHKLRGAESEGDQQFVANLAREHGLEFYVGSGDTARVAAEQHSGIEAAARELRYGFFGELLGSENGSEDSSTSGAEAQNLESAERSAESAAPPQGSAPRASLLTKIATGHTLDDQAETVLMRLIRGTGMRGLGGIYPRIVVEHGDGEGHGEIVRPLLEIRRRELEQYLADIKQPWREDSSNADLKFTRNRMRKMVLPLLEREFNPAVVEGLVELAEIARDEEDYWENEISGWLGTVVQWLEPDWLRTLPGFGALSSSLVQIGSRQLEPDPEMLARIEDSPALLMNASLSRPWLLTEPKAVQRRVLKAIGEQAGIPLEFKHVEEILRFAAEDGGTGKELSLPLGWKVLWEPEAMVFVTPDLRHGDAVVNYEYSLPVPGRAIVPELGGVIEALRVAPETQTAEYNPEQLLRADLLADRLTVRNWRPGDRFWPAHTKSPKKVKELLQERHIEKLARKLWPVITSADELIWLRGFPVPARLQPKAGQEAVLIREISSAADETTF